MSNYCAILIYTVSGMIAAISQLLLKIAAKGKTSATFIQKLLDIKVIGAYVLLMSTIFMNMIAMRYITYKYVPILSTISYIFVLVLSRIFLKETINKKQIGGMLCILTGIVIFNLG